MLDEDKALRSIMFPLLAIGSITTGHADLGDMFIGEAQRNKVTSFYMGDILALQSDLLMISDPLILFSLGNSTNYQYPHPVSH
jgi:hypothetical protein